MCFLYLGRMTISTGYLDMLVTVYNLHVMWKQNRVMVPKIAKVSSVAKTILLLVFRKVKWQNWVALDC